MSSFDFDRRHAVSAEQEAAWAADAPNRLERALWTAKAHVTRLAPSHTTFWLPNTVHGYAGILDHGPRSVTHGIVIHVNAGWFDGTKSFFTNGLNEPYGSQGVGAHFELGGGSRTPVYGDGPPYQFLSVDRVAWHAVDANGFAPGIEQAGFGASTHEWEVTHFNVVGNAAYRTAWMLHRFNLGPPHISLTNPNVGNIWPHSCGGMSWGGHDCPGPNYPWALFEKYCNTAYNTKWGWA
jgi:hypothetical protein